MMRWLLSIILLSLSAMPAFAADKKTPDADPYHDWLEYYYFHKDPAQVSDFIKWVQSSGTLDKLPGSLPPVEEFLTVVFAQNPALVQGWAQIGNAKGKLREVLDYAVKPPVQPDKYPVKTASDLDRMWAAWSASGDTAYLGKIVETLDPKDALQDKAATDAAMRLSAAWSLGANMTQHEAVERYITHESQTRTDVVGTELKKIIENVLKQREARALPNRNGDFSALIVVSDPKVAAREFARASQDVIHFKSMDRAKIGDKRAVVIVFAGMQLAEDYKSDVTYDMQVTNPAGMIYSEFKDLEGLKAKVPTRFRIFNSTAIATIAFDAKDKPGIYKISVHLKDNIGKKEIPLSAQITLRK